MKKFRRDVQNQVKHLKRARVFSENSSRLKSVNYFCKKLYHRFFDYVLNTPLTIVVNEVWDDTHEIRIRTKNQQNIKALLKVQML